MSALGARRKGPIGKTLLNLVENDPTRKLSHANAKGAGPKRTRSRNVIEVPWHKTPSTRRREVLVPEAGPPQDARPIRSENRAILVASIARGRRWLDELIADPTANTESIAGREGCSVRKVNMTISLAFLAPDLVKAAIDGRLPHGMGVARLCDLSRMVSSAPNAWTGRAVTPSRRQVRCRERPASADRH
jgi:hypothetical protein